MGMGQNALILTHSKNGNILYATPRLVRPGK